MLRGKIHQYWEHGQHPLCNQWLWPRISACFWPCPGPGWGRHWHTNLRALRPIFWCMGHLIEWAITKAAQCIPGCPAKQWLRLGHGWPRAAQPPLFKQPTTGDLGPNLEDVRPQSESRFCIELFLQGNLFRYLMCEFFAVTGVGVEVYLLCAVVAS